MILQYLVCTSLSSSASSLQRKPHPFPVSDPAKSERNAHRVALQAQIKGVVDDRDHYNHPNKTQSTQVSR